MPDDEFLEMVPIVTGEDAPGAGQMEKMLAQGQALLQTKTDYHTAIEVRKPRSLDAIVLKALKEADYAGEEFYYSWPVRDAKTGKTKNVEGATIGAAMAVMREWGNCALDVQVEDAGAFMVFTPRFVDLETGATFSRAFKYHPTAAPGRYDAERWADMQFQLAQSKAIRNVVVSAMPRWLIAQVVARAKKAELAKIDRVGIIEARQRAVDFYVRLGIEEARLVAHFGKPRENWDNEDVALLRNLAKQQREGEVDLERVFSPAAPPAQAEPQQPPKAGPSPEAEVPTLAVEGAGSAPTDPPASPQQVAAIVGLLKQRGAADRYQRDVGPTMAEQLGLASITESVARQLVDALTAEPPEWGIFDAALNPQAPPAPAQQQSTGRRGRTQQGTLV